MNDTISRQAAIDICLQYCPDDDGTCSKNGDDLRNMLDEIEALPSAQPERKTGHWQEISEHQIPIVCKCTECEWTTTHYDSFSYCPNCGADMRGDME